LVSNFGRGCGRRFYDTRGASDSIRHSIRRGVRCVKQCGIAQVLPLFAAVYARQLLQCIAQQCGFHIGMFHCWTVICLVRRASSGCDSNDEQIFLETLGIDMSEAVGFSRAYRGRHYTHGSVVPLRVRCLPWLDAPPFGNRFTTSSPL